MGASMSEGTFILGETGNAAAPAAHDDLVKETTTQNFRADVLDASREVPVLVDFWAPWCGPCRELAPVLERAVAKAKGKVRLVKMNIDDHPQIAGQLGIQSIPAVIAFKDGQPLDGFMGALAREPGDSLHRAHCRAGRPERRGAGAGSCRNRRWPSRTIPAPQRSTAACCRHDPNNMTGARRAGALLRGDGRAGAGARPVRRPDARAGAGSRPLPAPAPRWISPSQAEKLGRPDDLERRLQADPNDHQTRFDLALVLQWPRRPRSRGRPASGDRAPQPRLERRGGAQAARAVLRGLGHHRPGDRRRRASGFPRCCFPEPASGHRFRKRSCSNK